MDPATVGGIAAISKLIGLGIKGWSALDDRDFDKNDVEALRALMDAGAAESAKRKAAGSTAAALHLALVARAFGRAVGRHQEFHGKLLLSGGLQRWINRADRERQAEIEERVKLAALKVKQLGNDPRGEVEQIAALTEGPLATPYYRELWRVFSDPKLTIAEAGEEPPLVMSPTARREFERYFLLAYLTGLSGPAGRGIEEYLGGLRQYRGALVRDLLVENLATWGGGHVFGSVPRERWTEDDGVPFMPLEEVYVEPSGAIDHEGKQDEEREPLLALIERLVAPSAPAKVIVVAADFGSGKSLSARMLARRWAEQLVTSPARSLELPLPIHARCAEDFPSEKVDLELTVRRAWKRQASSFGYALSDEDDAFAWPSPEQRVVGLLDGLDEVALGEQHLKTLFQRLGGRTTRNHRFVIFSRPGALPSRRELGDDVVVVRVKPFDADQIQRWLGGWNRLRPEHPPIALHDLKERGLEALTETPILLFMVAFTWSKHATRAEPPSLAEIYEHFFYQVAAGKADADRERHGPIAAASEQLLAALQTAKVLDESAGPPDAMLWLMGRVAWEAHVLEQRHPPQILTKRHIDNLLQDGELPLPAGAADAIRTGLILALQADLHGANHTILFGHQSFREFLVGRYWALLLQRMARGGGRSDRVTAPLLGGRLLGDSDKSFDFLMELVNTTVAPPRSASPLSWSDPDRDALVRWAQDTFEDERQEFGERARPHHRAEPLLRNDRRAELREAALAIGSLTRGSPGLRARGSLTLRSMLAWFWMQSTNAIVIAPKARLRGAFLRGVDLSGAKLAEADLFEADLAAAKLFRADLSNAELRGADLTEANLLTAKLSEAHLDHADLSGANLYDAAASRCYLGGANLSGADLSCAHLIGADLTGAQLLAATLDWASLASADLRAASLQRASLQYTDLEGANLQNADLREANLIGANLCGANLTGARLDRSILRENLRGTEDHHELRFDEETVWPDGFDQSRLPSQPVTAAPPFRGPGTQRSSEP